jgi:hypothetical protein
MPEIGWCAPLPRAADIRAAGLDYLEAQIVPMALEDGTAFAEAKARVRDLPPPVLHSPMCTWRIPGV